MKAAVSPKKAPRVGPYSRALQRGALGDAIDGRSRAGKILRRTEQELLGQLGREASFGERLLIRRIARATLQLEMFDDKLATGGEFTAHDARAFSALSNQVRLGLRDLGLKTAPKDKAPSIADIAARHVKPQVAAE